MPSKQDYSVFHVLLTGGTGFFGRALLRHWRSQEQNGEKIAKVCVFSRNPESFLKQYPEFSGHSWLHFHQGDILSTSSLPKEEFTHLLHAATDSTLGPKLTPLERYIQIVDGTRNMLDYAVSNQIPRFLLTSSGGVYGPQPLGMLHIPEEYNGMPDPLKPENAYSVAKRFAEHLCELYADEYGIEIVIARCFAFVGQDLPLDSHFAIGNFINDALQNREITVKGNGSAIRTYLDQRDLSKWLTTLLYAGKCGEAYNVGCNEEISIFDLAKLVRDTIAPSVKIRILNNAELHNFRSRYVPNISKIQTHFNLKKNHTLQQSIFDVVRNIKY